MAPSAVALESGPRQIAGIARHQSKWPRRPAGRNEDNAPLQPRHCFHKVAPGISTRSEDSQSPLIPRPSPAEEGEPISASLEHRPFSIQDIHAQDSLENSVPRTPIPLEDFARKLVAGNQHCRSWREKLEFVRELLANETNLAAEQLVDLAVYLRFLGTGEIPVPRTDDTFVPPITRASPCKFRSGWRRWPRRKPPSSSAKFIRGCRPRRGNFSGPNRSRASAISRTETTFPPD